MMWLASSHSRPLAWVVSASARMNSQSGACRNAVGSNPALSAASRAASAPPPSRRADRGCAAAHKRLDLLARPQRDRAGDLGGLFRGAHQVAARQVALGRAVLVIGIGA